MHRSVTKERFPRLRDGGPTAERVDEAAWVAHIGNPLGDPITLCGIAGWGMERDDHADKPDCAQCLTIARYCKSLKGV